MQPTVQSEQDKMVPIDTSGDPVEVEIKEDTKEVSTPATETKEDTPVVEVEQPEQESAQSEKKEEELEEYSAGVKRRIDKLTKKMREAERREQAAIDYAKKVKEESDKLKSTSAVANEAMLVEREKALTNQREFAKRAYEAAINAQDVEKQVAAQQELSRLTIEDERLKVSKQKAIQRKAEAEKKPAEDVETAVNNMQQPTETTQRDPKADAWASKNEWFGNDNAMTYTAYDIHNNLMEEGFDPRSDDYYNEIDKRIRNEFPHKFSDGGDVSKPKQKVASAVRKSSTGRRTVKLTPSQVAIAKKLGVPLEEYAKHVKEA